MDCKERNDWFSTLECLPSCWGAGWRTYTESRWTTGWIGTKIHKGIAKLFLLPQRRCFRCTIANGWSNRPNMALRRVLRALRRHVLAPCRIAEQKYTSTKLPVNQDVSPFAGHDLLIWLSTIVGNFICPKCQYTGKFSVIEDFFPEPKAKDQQVDIAQKREKFQSRKPVVRIELPSVTPVKDMSDQECLELANNFSLVISSDLWV